MRAFHKAATTLVCAALCACAVPIATSLDESDANRVIVALQKKGVAADKEPDPDQEGEWQVSVARDEASAAVAILAQEGLPRAASPGVLDALGEDSIVPSRTAEHAKLVAGTAGDLERSLTAVDGVIGARVHLAMPERDALALDAPAPKVTASVLLRHRGATPPIGTLDVQRLVAGAVPGLLPEHVSVVATPSPVHSGSHDRELSRFGPVTVVRSSLSWLRGVVGAVVLINLVLLGLLYAVWSRMKKAQLALGDARAAAEDSPGAR